MSRLQVDEIVNKDDAGAPSFPYGATVSGILTSSSFVGDLTGNATYASSAGIATYAASAGIATYASSAGIATYASSAGIATTSTSASTAYGLTGTPDIIVGNTRVGTALSLTGYYIENITEVPASNIDCSQGNYFIKSINDNTTFSFSNVPSSGAYSLTLELTHTSGTVTWPSEVKWPGDTAPSLTTGKTHIFIFVTDDGGTRWRGASLVNYTNYVL